MVSRALLVGINKYPRHVQGPLKVFERLSGCVNDAKAMAQFIRTRCGLAPSEMRLLTDGQATKATILRSLRWPVAVCFSSSAATARRIPTCSPAAAPITPRSVRSISTGLASIRSPTWISRLSSSAFQKPWNSPGSPIVAFRAAPPKVSQPRGLMGPDTRPWLRPSAWHRSCARRASIRGSSALATTVGRSRSRASSRQRAEGRPLTINSTRSSAENAA